MKYLELLLVAIFTHNACSQLHKVGHFEYSFWSPEDGLQTINKAVFVSDVRRNFMEAEALCNKNKLELLALYSSEVNPTFNKYNAFKSFHREDYACLEEYSFIGGTRNNSAEPWKDLYNRSINYNLDWAPGEPNNPNTEFCLTVRRDPNTNAFGMNDYFCYLSQKFICEEITDYTKMDVVGSGLTVTYNNAGHEIDGFKLIGQFEYTFDTQLWGRRTALTNIHLSTNKLNFDDSIKSCASNGLKMLTLESSKFNLDFNKYSAFQSLFGQMYKNFDEYISIGIRKINANSNFTLIDSSPLKYSLDFALGEPNNPITELCMSVHSPLFGMNDHSCMETMKFFCEAPLDFDWIDNPTFSSLQSVAYKARMTTCGLSFPGGIVSRKVPNNGTYKTEPGVLSSLTTLASTTKGSAFGESF